MGSRNDGDEIGPAHRLDRDQRVIGHCDRHQRLAAPGGQVVLDLVNRQNIEEQFDAGHLLGELAQRLRHQRARDARR